MTKLQLGKIKKKYGASKRTTMSALDTMLAINLASREDNDLVANLLIGMGPSAVEHFAFGDGRVCLIGTPTMTLEFKYWGK